mgnify:CR=1 FL=1
MAQPIKRQSDSGFDRAERQARLQRNLAMGEITIESEPDQLCLLYEQK